jgi:hypothetical protein
LRIGLLLSFAGGDAPFATRAAKLDVAFLIDEQNLHAVLVTIGETTLARAALSAIVRV